MNPNRSDLMSRAWLGLLGTLNELHQNGYPYELAMELQGCHGATAMLMF